MLSSLINIPLYNVKDAGAAFPDNLLRESLIRGHRSHCPVAQFERRDAVADCVPDFSVRGNVCRQKNIVNAAFELKSLAREYHFIGL